MAYCSHCGAALAGGATFCGRCGNVVGSGPQVATTAPPVNVHVTVSHAGGAASAPSMGIAIVALILNILVWPGLGSLIAGENVGWAQGFLFLLGFALIFTLVGIIIAIPLMIGMWVWGIVTGVQVINRANASTAAAARVV